MDVIEYIDTISVNGFSDWVRCHNDMLHNNVTCDDNALSDEVADKEIRMISHILKILYNEKISVTNKYYILISIEENLEYFIKTENGAINLVQSLTTGLKNSINSKWQHQYMCQLLIVICSSSIYFDLFISALHQCSSFVQELLKILFDIISSDNMTTNWVNLKHTALTSMLHLESTYPTLLSQYETRLAEMVQKDRTIHFELLIQIYSAVFTNNIRNKFRLQQNAGSSPASEVTTKDRIASCIEWSQKPRGAHEQKIVGSQANVLKSLRTMLEQAINNLSPLATNHIVRNCLITTDCLTQHNPSLWTPFISRFISTSNLSILEVLLALKTASRSCDVEDGLLPGEQLQETMLAVLNNCRVFVPKRQMIAQWLYSYPFKDQASAMAITNSTETAICTFEPELMRHFYLRSIDILEIKYCKLMLLSRAFRLSSLSDFSSMLFFSSLKEIIKSLHYFDSDLPSNILLRIMFVIHIQHPRSALARDFESILEDLVVQYPNILSSVMFYLNALEKNLSGDEQSRNFSVKCLTQIVKLSSEMISTSTNVVELGNIKLHIKILNYVIRFSDIDIVDYLAVLCNVLSISKMDLDATWIEEAYELIINMCFNVIKKYGSSKHYKELTSILNEIRHELIGNSTDIKANFLYVLIVSLPSKKAKELLGKKPFEEIMECDFQLIQSSLIQSHLDECPLIMIRERSVSTSEASRHQYDGSLDGYTQFLKCNTFTLKFQAEIIAKGDFIVEHFLYGVNVEFQTDSYFVDIDPWHISFIRSGDDDKFSIRKSLEVNIKEPEMFSVHGTLAATKIDGTFVIYGVKSETIGLLDLSLSVPCEFSTDELKSLFLRDLQKDRTIIRSFVAINFKNESNLQNFNRSFAKFLFLEDPDWRYIMFLPPHNHIVLSLSIISSFWRRVDVSTDLKMINLISIEEYLKTFEL